MSTRFERLTESPEVLADFLGRYINCLLCPIRQSKEACDKACEQELRKWLEEDSNG